MYQGLEGLAEERRFSGNVSELVRPPHQVIVEHQSGSDRTPPAYNTNHFIRDAEEPALTTPQHK